MTNYNKLSKEQYLKFRYLQYDIGLRKKGDKKKLREDEEKEYQKLLFIRNLEKANDKLRRR